VRGDLAAAGLGLSASATEKLEGTDAIVHCGAFVHHLHGYPAMKAANVEGTRALLALALKKKMKPFCFVSTLSAGAIIEGADRIEEAVLPNRPVVDSGYILTKWTAEQLVAGCARKYGLPAVIARPGNITGRSDTGFTNFSNNHFWLFAKGCLQLGAYPEVPAPVEMTPVDILARAIAALAVSRREGLLVANLSNPVTLTQAEFFAELAACGLRAEAKPAAEWQALLPAIGEENALSTIKDFYTGDLGGSLPPVERSLTARALAEAGASLAADYGTLIPVYVEYLRKAGFLA
jgi:thioester reductase-like protein